MKTHEKNLTKVLTLSVLIFSTVYLVLSGVYSLILTDIVYSMTILPIVIEIPILLLDLCAYGVCFSAFIYSIHRRGVKSSMPMVLIYSGVLLVKKLVDTTVGHIIFGTGWDLEGLIYVLLIWIVEILLAFTVVLIAHLCLRGKENQDLSPVTFYSRANAIQNCALFVALVISAIKLIERIIFDIGYGAPTGTVDLLWMIAGYTSDLMAGFIVYLISFFFIKKLYQKDNA